MRTARIARERGSVTTGRGFAPIQRMCSQNLPNIRFLGVAEFAILSITRAAVLVRGDLETCTDEVMTSEAAGPGTGTPNSREDSASSASVSVQECTDTGSS
jgi:hypothetical protein